MGITADRLDAAWRAEADRIDTEITALTTERDTARTQAQHLHDALTTEQTRTADLTRRLTASDAAVADRDRLLQAALADADAKSATITAQRIEIEDLRATVEDCRTNHTPTPTRDAVQQPYASTCFLNLARPIDATLGTTSHPMAVSLRSVKGGFNRTTFTTPINVADDNPRPLYIQEVPEGAWRPSSSDVRHEIPWAPASITIAGDMTAYPPAYNTDGSITFPTAPAGTKPDGFFSVINPATGQAIQSYKTCWGPDGPAGRTLIARRGTVKAYDLRGDVLDVHGFRASRLDGIGGLIRNGELEDGIHHMLYLGVRKEQLQAISGSATGFVPPARGRDSAGGYTGTIPLGQQFFIRPEVDVDALGLSPGGLILARCLQEYGAMPVDTAGWTVLYFEQGPLTSYYDAAKTDWQTKLLPLLVPRLDVVTMDNLSTGTRIRPPLAPVV